MQHFRKSDHASVWRHWIHWRILGRLPRRSRELEEGEPMDDIRTAALILAAEAKVDPRTARRALETGLQAVRPGLMRERVSGSARKLGLTLPLK